MKSFILHKWWKTKALEFSMNHYQGTSQFWSNTRHNSFYKALLQVSNIFFSFLNSIEFFSYTALKRQYIPKNLDNWDALSLPLKLQVPNKWLCKYLQNTINPRPESLPRPFCISASLSFPHLPKSDQYFILMTRYRECHCNTWIFVNTGHHFWLHYWPKQFQIHIAQSFPTHTLESSLFSRTSFPSLSLPVHMFWHNHRKNNCFPYVYHWPATLLLQRIHYNKEIVHPMGQA